MAEGFDSSKYVSKLLADAYHRGFKDGEERAAATRSADLSLIRQRNQQLYEIRRTLEALLASLPEGRKT